MAYKKESFTIFLKVKNKKKIEALWAPRKKNPINQVAANRKRLGTFAVTHKLPIYNKFATVLNLLKN